MEEIRNIDGSNHNARDIIHKSYRIPLTIFTVPARLNTSLSHLRRLNLVFPIRKVPVEYQKDFR